MGEPGPGVLLAGELLAEQGAGALVLHDQDGARPGDGDAEPVVARAEVAGEINSEGRFTGAAVAVEHDVAVGGDEGVVAFAE